MQLDSVNGPPLSRRPNGAGGEARRLGLLTLIALSLVALGCSSFASVLSQAAGQRSSTASPAAAAPEIAEQTVRPPAAPTAWTPHAQQRLNPLTGLPPASPQHLQRMPLAIKVSNFPVQGRPHSGLSFADLIFEYYIGVGMSRFLALYYGQDSPEVGPIRSGRLIDGQLARMYGAALGMKGADPYVYRVLEERLPDRVYSAQPALCPALCPYTTAYTYGTFGDTAAFSELLKEEAADRGAPDLSGMTFAANPPSAGEPAARLWLVYSHLNQIGWEFDPELGAYLRWQDNADTVLAPMPDKVTGEQLAFENVVVVFAEHVYQSPTLIEVELWGQQGQPAVVFRDGHAYEVTWSVPTRESPLRFERQRAPFPLKPGSTWLQIFSLESEPERLEDGRWRLRFRE